MMKTETLQRTRGRPRKFDLDKALDRALDVFWRKGYEGASLPNLTRAMRINRPSLYAAFGNKEELFRKALDRYAQGPAAYIQKALKQKTARQVVEKLWNGITDVAADPKNPRGCLAVQGALVCGDSSKEIRKELIARRLLVENAVRERFEQARDEGDLPRQVNCGDLARFVSTISYGLAVQAASGANHQDMRRIVQTALAAWPR